MTMTITDSIDWKLYDHPKIVAPSTLHWTSDDPLTVEVSFHVGLDAPVQWLIGRDLFHDAITRNTAGEGDVRIAVVDDQMLLTLDSPFGTEKFITRASDIGMFLARTYTVVPRDKEAYDLSDEAIAKFFSETA